MSNLMTRLFGYKVDPEVLHSYRTVIPNTLMFSTKKEHDKYIIKITEIDGKVLDNKTLLISEADKKDEVVHVVNDLIMTYLNVPETLRPYYEKDLSLEGDLNNNSRLVKA